MDSKPFLKASQWAKRIETLLVFAMAALRLAVVPWNIRANQFVPYNEIHKNFPNAIDFFWKVCYNIYSIKECGAFLRESK